MQSIIITLHQISILLILFFTSLSATVFMVGRKLVLLRQQHGEVLNHEEVLFELPYLKEAKHATIKGIKKHGYALLVGIIRLYVRSANFLKSKYEVLKSKLRNEHKAEQTTGDKKEISKFLKNVLEYKQKIREIKHRIKEEENL